MYTYFQVDILCNGETKNRRNLKGIKRKIHFFDGWMQREGRTLTTYRNQTKTKKPSASDRLFSFTCVLNIC